MELSEALQYNTHSPIPEQVSFRLDFPAWYTRQQERTRKVIDELMRGERTKAVAHRHHLSPGRISQLRRELHEGWQAFLGETVAR